MLGLMPNPNDIGRPYAEVLEDCRKSCGFLDSAFETSESPNRAELRLRKTGRAVGYTISKIHDDEQEEVGLTVFLKDLTTSNRSGTRAIAGTPATLGGMAGPLPTR